MDWGVWLVGAAFIAGAVLLFNFGVVPLLLRRMFWFEPSVQVEHIDPNAPDVPEEAALYLARAAEDLEALGFAYLTFIRVRDAYPNGWMYVGCFTNERDRCAAAAGTMYNKVKEVTRVEQCLEFSTDLLDGRELMTNNAETVPSRTSPERRAVSARRVREPRALYRVHQSLLRSEGDPPRNSAAPARVMQQLDQMMLREGERYLRSGWWSKAQDGRLRLTLLGAYMFTWKLIWPGIRIRRWLFDRAAAPLIRDAGI